MVLLVALTLFLAGCGDDDNGDGGNGGSGETAETDNFEIEVPDGWEDATDRADEFSTGGFTPEVILIGEREGDVQANLNVIREENVDDDTSLEEYVETSRSQLEQGAGGLPGGDVGEPEETDLGGEDALAVEYGRELQGTAVEFRQVYAIRDGSGYAVTLTSSEEAFDDERDRFDDAVESWEWK